MKRFTLLILSLVFLGFTAITSADAQDKNLHEPYDKVLKEYVSNGMVDYAKLKKNRSSLDAYLTKLAGIDKKQFDSWPESSRLAYLINLYNAATLQLIIDNYPLKSIKDIGSFFKGPWDQSVVMLFGKKITLNNLEHDIIRKEYKEPRVHMALVCAAKGCPPLRSEAYVAERLDEQLNDQSKTYLTSPKGMRIEKSKGRIYLSAIFKWYGDDFPSVTAFAEKHSGQSLDGLSISWLAYDWSLNERK
jgi:hypothetical protein